MTKTGSKDWGSGWGLAFSSALGLGLGSASVGSSAGGCGVGLGAHRTITAMGAPCLTWSCSITHWTAVALARFISVWSSMRKLARTFSGTAVACLKSAAMSAAMTRAGWK